MVLMVRQQKANNNCLKNKCKMVRPDGNCAAYMDPNYEWGMANLHDRKCLGLRTTLEELQELHDDLASYRRKDRANTRNPKRELCKTSGNSAEKEILRLISYYQTQGD